MANDPLKPLSPRDWDAQKAQHLLNRAGFGIPHERVEFFTQQGHRKSVQSLVEYENIPKHGESPTFLIPSEEYRATRQIKDEIERREARRMVQRRERKAMVLLQQWWLERMLHSPRPLEEKMTLFWHGHFATSAQKVKSSRMNEHLHNQFRLHATGNFKSLTTAVAKSPAMLNYLDNNRNVKKHPNENWARELMELFTLGIDNYTEDDIKESARAFTGWKYTQERFVFNKKVHDTGAKTFLGKTGNFAGDDIIDIIFEQEATAQFICTKLYTFFAQEEPDEAVIQAMAHEFRSNGYEVKPVLEKLFMSEAFYSSTVMGSQIKSPAHFIIQLTNDMNMKYPPYSSMARATAQLGQHLFYPPNVKGWDGGRTWINANTLLTRYNLPVSLGKANGKLEMARMEKSMNPRMDATMSPGKDNDRKNQREKFQAIMASMPESQQRTIRKKMKAAPNPKKRKDIITAILDRHGDQERWNATLVFDLLKFTTAKECVEQLSQRFLTQELTPRQQLVLIKALGVETGRNTPLTHKDISSSHMNATLHLLLSTAEYQLC